MKYHIHFKSNLHTVTQDTSGCLYGNLLELHSATGRQIPQCSFIVFPLLYFTFLRIYACLLIFFKPTGLRVCNFLSDFVLLQLDQNYLQSC